MYNYALLVEMGIFCYAFLPLIFLMLPTIIKTHAKRIIKSRTGRKCTRCVTIMYIREFWTYISLTIDTRCNQYYIYTHKISLKKFTVLPVKRRSTPCATFHHVLYFSTFQTLWFLVQRATVVTMVSIAVTKNGFWVRHCQSMGGNSESKVSVELAVILSLQHIVMHSWA